MVYNLNNFFLLLCMCAEGTSNSDLFHLQFDNTEISIIFAYFL